MIVNLAFKLDISIYLSIINVVLVMKDVLSVRMKHFRIAADVIQAITYGRELLVLQHAMKVGMMQI
jgi:hypothetical protein